MKNNSLSFLMLSLTGIIFSANLYTNQSPVGVWKTINYKTKKVKSHIQIYEKNGIYYGKVIKISNPAKRNSVCDKCKGEKHNKPIMGLVIMWDLKKNGNKYSGGKILDPKNGKTYRCYIQVLEGGKKLKIRCYIGSSLFGRTKYWYRAN